MVCVRGNDVIWDDMLIDLLSGHWVGIWETGQPGLWDDAVNVGTQENGLKGKMYFN